MVRTRCADDGLQIAEDMSFSANRVGPNKNSDCPRMQVGEWLVKPKDFWEFGHAIAEGAKREVLNKLRRRRSRCCCVRPQVAWCCSELLVVVVVAGNNILTSLGRFRLTTDFLSSFRPQPYCRALILLGPLGYMTT